MASRVERLAEEGLQLREVSEVDEAAINCLDDEEFEQFVIILRKVKAGYPEESQPGCIWI